MNFSFLKEPKYWAPLLTALVCFFYWTLLGLNNYGLSYQSIPDTETYLQLIPDVFSNHRSNYVRTIGYPLILTWIQWMAGVLHLSWPFLVYILQSVLFIITIHILMVILGGVTRNYWVSFIVLLIILNPSFYLFSYLLSTEISFLFFLVLGIYFSSNKNLKGAGYGRLLGFFLFCFATLIRPGLYYFLLGYGLFLLLENVHKLQWKKVVLILLIYTATIGFQQWIFYRNFKLVSLSLIEDITRSRYLGSSIEQITTQQDCLQIMERKDSALHKFLNHESKPLNNDLRILKTYYNQDIYSTVKANPIYSFVAFVKNIWANTHTGNTYYLKKQTLLQREIFNITRIFNMFCCFCLIVSNIWVGINLFRKRKIPGYLMMLLLVIGNYLYLTSGISYWQGDRFNIIWTPLLILIAGLVLRHCQEKNILKAEIGK